MKRMTSVQGTGNSGALTAALNVLLAHGGAALLVGQLGHALGFALLRDAQLGILLQCGVLPALLILAQEPLCPAPLLPRKQGPLSGIGLPVIMYKSHLVRATCCRRVRFSSAFRTARMV